jgi:Tfp pilus assembly protein FimT
MVELVLVMVIIVVIASLAVPAIQNTVNNQAISKAADRVRVAMGQARVRAIRSGKVHALYYSQGGQWFEVAPLENYAQFAGQFNNSNQTTTLDRDFSENFLPRDVRFVAGQASMDNRSESAKQNSDGGAGMNAILFYPDGTSQDARLILQNARGALISVELRGLTGIAKSVRMVSQQ